MHIKIRKDAIHILKVDMASIAENQIELDDGVELKWIEADEQHLIIDSPYRPENTTRPALLERHYANDGTVCAAFANGDAVAWVLFTPHFQRVFLWLEVHGTKQSLFGISAFTAPQARGKRLMSALSAEAARRYVALGYSTLMSTTNCDNTSAHSAQSHLNMQRIGKIESTRWPFGFRTIWIDGKLTTGFYGRQNPLIHRVS